MASDITSGGATLYDLLGREGKSLREDREKALSRDLDMSQARESASLRERPTARLALASLHAAFRAAHACLITAAFPPISPRARPSERDIRGREA